eukprot:2461786-Rhodomonas_salina.1
MSRPSTRPTASHVTVTESEPERLRHLESGHVRARAQYATVTFRFRRIGETDGMLHDITGRGTCGDPDSVA